MRPYRGVCATRIQRERKVASPPEMVGHRCGVDLTNKSDPECYWQSGVGCTIGAPSAWISLARLRPRRARLRFSKPSEVTAAGYRRKHHRTPERCLENPIPGLPRRPGYTHRFRGRAILFRPLRGEECFVRQSGKQLRILNFVGRHLAIDRELF